MLLLPIHEHGICLKKVKMELLYDPVILHQGIYQKKPEVLIWENICTPGQFGLVGWSSWFQFPIRVHTRVVGLILNQGTYEKAVNWCFSLTTIFSLSKSNEKMPSDEDKKKRIYSPLFIAALFIIAKIWKQPKYPLIVEWFKKLWCIYTMEVLFSHKKGYLTIFYRMDGPGEYHAM